MEAVHSDKYTYFDHYGNSINYQLNYISISSFIDYLKDLNMIDYAYEKISTLSV